MEKIILWNRDGDKITLSLVDNNSWLFNSEKNYPLRIIYDTDNTSILAIDPSGGPFLNIGYDYTGFDEKGKRVNFTIEGIEEKKGFFLKLTLIKDKKA